MTPPDVYERCVSHFADQCKRLGEGLVSVLLYGSIARGDVRPGSSDVLDAVVVLDDQVLENEREFVQALSVLVEACKDLSASGLPFHPFHYYTLSEIRQSHWGLYSLIWKSDRYSRVLAGRDLRPEIKTSDREGVLTRAALFGCRRSVQRMVRFLGAESEGAAGSLKSAVDWFLKDMFKLACFACGDGREYPEALDQVKSFFPDLDLGALDQLNAVHLAKNPDTQESCAAIWGGISLNEDLQRRVVERTKRQNEWDAFIAAIVGPESARVEASEAKL